MHISLVASCETMKLGSKIFFVSKDEFSQWLITLVELEGIAARDGLVTLTLIKIHSPD